MPLPLLLIGPIIYGTKKVIDAKNNFDEANKYNKMAKDIVDEANKKLEIAKYNTNSNLKKLRKLKVNIYKNSLKKFVDVFLQIKHIDFNDNLQLGLLSSLDKKPVKMKEIVEWNLDTSYIVGIATGMVVLGGPFGLIIGGGWVLSEKVEKAKYTAYENYEKAKSYTEEIDTICVVLDGIIKRTYEFIKILDKLNQYLFDYNNMLKYIIKNVGNDYRLYHKQVKQDVMIALSLAQTIKNICDTPIIDENGEITKQSKKVLQIANELTQKIARI